MPEVLNTRTVKSRLSESPLQSTQAKGARTKPILAVQSMGVQRLIARMPQIQLLLNKHKQKDRRNLDHRRSGLHSWTMPYRIQTWTYPSQIQRWCIMWRILLLALPSLLELKHAGATKQRKPKTKAMAITRFKMNINTKTLYMAPMIALLSFSRSKILT